MSGRHGILWAALTLASAPLQAADAPALQDYLEHDWYRTEILVFERPDVQDFRVTEALARQRRLESVNILRGNQILIRNQFFLK